MLISKTLPNLMNGVSQQPDALRFDTQCADQVNAYPSVVEGLTKRLPTEHICKTNLTGDASTFVHTINREGNEKYTVLVRDQLIRVYDINGNQKTVEIDASVGANADSIAYLDTDTAATSIKALTIADVTYLTNTEKEVSMTGTTPASVSEHEALVFVKQAYDSIYDVTIKQGDTSIVATVDAPSSNPSTKDIATSLAQQLNVEGAAGTQSYTTSATNQLNTGSNTLSAQSFQVQTADKITQFKWKSARDSTGFLYTSYGWAICADNGSGAPGTALVGSTFNLTNISWSSPEPNKFEIQTVVVPNGGFVPTPNTTYWLVQRLYRVDTFGTPILQNLLSSWFHGTANSYPTNNAFTASSYYNGQVQSGDFYFIIFQQGASALTTVSATASGSSIYINASEDFSITSTNTYTDTYIESFKGKVQKFTSLPKIAKDRMILQIEGEPDSGIDDYYVKFVTTAAPGGLGEGSWEECAGPNIENGLALNAGTMPHILIKQPNGTFVLKAANGSNHTSTSTGTEATYDYSKFAWGNRLAGDQITNPDPTFVGKTINNLFLFKNRLGVLADENIIFSEAGEYFNFFRFTVIDLLDTAVIDIASASSEVSTLRYALPLAERLVVLSDQAQFFVQADTALSARTVSIARSTAFNIIPNAEPTASENSLFFAFNRGSYSGVREYFPTDLQETFEGVDISTQVPKYIPSDISKLTAANHENVVFAMSTGDTDSLYVYNYYNNASKRVQSAWHRWEFGTGTKVLNIDLIDTDLYLTMYRAEGVFIEKMAIEIGKTDVGSEYVSCLDRRIDQSKCTVNGATITLPYNKTPGRNIEIITTGGERIKVSTQADGSNQVTAEKSLTGVNFYIGEAYEMSYTFSDVTLKEGTQTGGLAVMTDGRIQIRYATVTYGESGSFNISVTPNFRDTSTYTFTGKILGSGEMTLGSVPLESGEFRFPIFSKADQVGITIKNDTPLPSKFLSAEYELSWNPRSRRM